MKIFKDIFNGDEICTDANPVKVIEDGLVYEVEAKVIQKTEGENFDIGANPSAEAAGETYDSTTVSVINVVDANRLVESPFDKKSYMAYIKAYMKRLSEKLKETAPDRVVPFQKSAQEFVKKVIGNFDDYSFYMGASMDPEAMVILMKYAEDGLTPFFYYFKDGIEEEKV